MTENVIDCRTPAALVYFLLNASASGSDCGNSFLQYLTSGDWRKYSQGARTKRLKPINTFFTNFNNTKISSKIIIYAVYMTKILIKTGKVSLLAEVNDIYLAIIFLPSSTFKDFKPCIC